MRPALPDASMVGRSPAAADDRFASSRIVDVAFLLTLPALAYWLMHFKPMVQNSFLDPYIYTGYIHNSESLFDRYGLTYYGVRFGLILPGQLAAASFGPIAGYFVYRYCLVLALAGPFYVLITQRFGRIAAVALCAALVTSPYLARAVLWDHPDASGVPLLFGSMCLFLIEHPKRRLLDFVAGVLGALALHSNVFVIAPLGIFTICCGLAWLAWGRGVWLLAERLAAMAAAVVIVTVGGCAYYWWSVGDWDIFTPTIQTTLWLSTGGMQNWRTQDPRWVSESWYVLLPVVLAVVSFASGVSRRVEFHWTAAWTGATATIAFFYVHQFLMNGNSLEVYYYFSYALPAVFLLLALTAAAVWRRATAVVQGIAGCVFVAFAVAPWVRYSIEPPVPPGTFIEYIAIVGIAAVIVVTASRARAIGAPATLMASAALGLILFASFERPPYAEMINSRVQPVRIEMDVYRAALRFIDVIPPHEHRNDVRFWYNDDPTSNSMRSLQSTFLWGRSKLQGERGMPHLAEEELALLRAPTLKWLVLLAERQEDLQLAREALEAHGVEHRRSRAEHLAEGSFGVYVDVLELSRR